MPAPTDPELSQVIIGVTDLDAASARLEAQGLAVVDGGRHPGVGTANRIIPLGRQYVELLAVVDEPTARQSDYGRSLLERTAAGDALVRWSLRTHDIDGAAERLGLTVEHRQRDRPDGERLTWRAAGLAVALEHPSLPFFMQWDRDEQYPGLTPVEHPNGANGVAWLEVTPVDGRFTAWTAGAVAPLRVGTGPPGLGRVAVATPAGDVTLTVGSA